MKEQLLNSIRGFLSTGEANLSSEEFEELLDSVQSDIDILRSPSEEDEEDDNEVEEDEDA